MPRRQVKVRGTLELIITQHATDRLNDIVRFRVPPRLPINEEVRLLQYLRADTKQEAWMCQIEDGFLVGQIRWTRRRQMLVVFTAINRQMFRKHVYMRIACHRVIVDKITLEAVADKRDEA